MGPPPSLDLWNLSQTISDAECPDCHISEDGFKFTITNFVVSSITCGGGGCHLKKMPVTHGTLKRILAKT